MIKLVYSQIKPTTSLTNGIPQDEKFLENAAMNQPVTSHIKLIVSNSNPNPFSAQKLTISNSTATSRFATKILLKGPNLYEMLFEDFTYGLKCDVILEIEKTDHEVDSVDVICHFPNIDDSILNEFVEEDETLLGMFMIQFQMKVLEQLLLFCANHYASKLVIFVDDAQADALGIYQDFLTYKDETITAQGEKTEMIITTGRETFDQWIDFMEEVTTDFQRTLWREQTNNPIIRQYLQRHSVSSV